MLVVEKGECMSEWYVGLRSRDLMFCFCDKHDVFCQCFVLRKFSCNVTFRIMVCVTHGWFYVGPFHDLVYVE